MNSALSAKQDVLTAGDNVDITNNVVSVSNIRVEDGDSTGRFSSSGFSFTREDNHDSNYKFVYSDTLFDDQLGLSETVYPAGQSTPSIRRGISLNYSGINLWNYAKSPTSIWISYQGDYHLGVGRSATNPEKTVAFLSDIHCPELPSSSSDGTYVLKATKSNGTVTYT